VEGGRIRREAVGKVQFGIPGMVGSGFHFSGLVDPAPEIHPNDGCDSGFTGSLSTDFVLSYGTGLLPFGAVAFVASIAPVRRALRIDLASELRYQ
jgi:ABC-type antimicrobial peptide transport system permease subunit